MQIGGMNVVQDKPPRKDGSLIWSGGMVAVCQPDCSYCDGTGLDDEHKYLCICAEFVTPPDTLFLSEMIEQCKEN